MRRSTDPIPVEGPIEAFPRGGRPPQGRMSRLVAEYGHGRALRLPPHRNPGLEIVYLRHGHLVWQHEGHQVALAPNTVFFTLPWEAHGSAAEFEPGHEWYFAVIRLEGGGIHRPTPFTFPAPLGLGGETGRTIRQLLCKASRRAWTATPMMATLFPALIHELDHPGLFHDREAERLVSLLVLELTRILSGGEGSRSMPGTGAHFQTFLHQLGMRCHEAWTLEGMAASAGLKRTQFTALFRHHTGDTPFCYLNRLRVEKARRLLTRTNQSITNIAMECGFASSQYFANVFKRFTGMSAIEYRQRHHDPASPRSSGRNRSSARASRIA